MKKYLFCLVLFLSLATITYAQNLDGFLKRVSHTENVDKVKISGLMMFLGKKFGGVNDMPLAKGMESLEVYSLSDCSDNLKGDFSKLFYGYKDGKDYETLIYTKDGNDRVRILMKKKQDAYREIVLLCMDETDPTIIRFSGKIKEKDIESLIGGYKK